MANKTCRRQMMDPSAIAETQWLIREAWATVGRSSPSGRILALPGACIVDSGQPWLFTNGVFLNEPIASPADLKALAEAALNHFRPSGHEWFLSASEEWLGPSADEVLSGLGLIHAMTVIAMAADQLLPPTRPLPDVVVRRIDDEDTRLVIAELNAAAYDVSLEWGHRAVGHGRLWQEPLFGHVAYIDGIPAAAGFAIPIAGALYVAWLATASPYRGRGLAELVMRRSLAEARLATGIERTVLHATQEGLGLYRRMGYLPVASYPLWEPAHP